MAQNKLSILKDGMDFSGKKTYILGNERAQINSLPALEEYASNCLGIIRDAKIVEYADGSSKAVKSGEDIDDMENIAKITGISGAEVFATKSQKYIVPISYASAFKKNDITRPTSDESTGLGLRLVFDDGTIANEGARMIFTEESLLNLLGIGYKGRVYDPDFRGLPVPISGEEIDTGQKFYDNAVIALNDSGAIKIAHEVVRGALEVYGDAIDKGTLKIEKNIINLGPGVPPMEEVLTNITIHGDAGITKEMVATESTTGIKASEMHTGLRGSVMSGYEVASPDRTWGFEEESKARGRDSAINLKDFNPGEIGASAARNALKFSGSKTIDDGYYTVIFRPQVISEMVLYVVGQSLTLSDFMHDSIFPPSDIGKQVISEKLSIYDYPHRQDSISSRRMTGEGIPTQKTMLIENGVLKNYIKDAYHANKYRALLESRGIDTRPSNGFRLEEGISTIGMVHPIFTTLVLEGNDTVPMEAMTSGIENGQKAIVFDVGWYSYPTHKEPRENNRDRGNKHSHGSMTTSSPAGSHILERDDNGELTATLIKPNTFRMFASVLDVLSNPGLEISTEQQKIYPWASNYTIVAPAIKADNIYLKRVGKYLDK